MSLCHLQHTEANIHLTVEKGHKTDICTNWQLSGEKALLLWPMSTRESTHQWRPGAVFAACCYGACSAWPVKYRISTLWQAGVNLGANDLNQGAAFWIEWQNQIYHWVSGDVCSGKLLIKQVLRRISVSQTWLRLGWSWPVTPYFAPLGINSSNEPLWSLPRLRLLLLSAALLRRPRSLTRTRAQSAVLPSGPLDAHALQGNSTLIDPTCHAEAMANFSTACIWNSGDGELTWFNNSQRKRRLARDNNVSDTF